MENILRITIRVILLVVLVGVVSLLTVLFLNHTYAEANDNVPKVIDCDVIKKTEEKVIEPEVVYEPEVVKPDTKDIEMLACVIYQEAGGDAASDECRRMVADVVLNRVDDPRFPNDIHSVLTAKGQYGRFYWTGIVWPERAKNPGEKHAVERAYRIAEEVLSGNHSALYGRGYIWQAEFPQGTDVVYHCNIHFGK